jgi:hypothetical protein
MTGLEFDGTAQNLSMAGFGICGVEYSGSNATKLAVSTAAGDGENRTE